MTGRSRHREQGQATVELALALPLLCTLLLAVVQVVTVVGDVLSVQLAAREGARAAVADPDPRPAGETAAARATSLPVRVEVAIDQGLVTVTVSARSPTDVPLVGVLLPDVPVRAAVTMRLEPP